jgi:hypothetical protein
MNPTQFNIENKKEYLYVTLTPYHSVDEMKSQIAQIHNAVDLYKCRKLLIDVTSTKEKIPILQLFDICVYLVEKLGEANPKIAALVSATAIYDDRFGENVIRNRGMDIMRFVTDTTQALNWLNN